jgi:glucose-1-phosphate cytidylyltransferase
MNNKHSNIPIIILAGGKGERFISKDNLPKQLTKVSDNPIIIEIIKHYFRSGFNYFILPLGYKKKYFIEFFNNKINIKKYNLNILKKNSTNLIKDKINIMIFNAGLVSDKLTRIKYSVKFLKKNNSIFGVAYGDVYANINFEKAISKLKNNSLRCILTTYKEFSPFGHLFLKNSKVIKFIEKPRLEIPINIGFYFFKKEIFNKIYFKKNYDLESGLLNNLIKKKYLGYYMHNGFHFTVNNQKDLINIKKLYKKNKILFNKST